jgi:uncharacterized membrane protein
MGLLKNKWLWVAALGVLLSAGLLVVLVGYVGLVVYTALLTGAPIVSTLVDIALPTLLGLAVLTVLFAVSLVGLLYVLVQNASLPRSERIAALAERAEKEYSPLKVVGLSDLLTPPEPSADEQAERALARLKQQYVDGELSEEEFERKVDRLVSNDSIDEARAARERREVTRTERN